MLPRGALQGWAVSFLEIGVYPRWLGKIRASLVALPLHCRRQLSRRLLSRNTGQRLAPRPTAKTGEGAPLPRDEIDENALAASSGIAMIGLSTLDVNELLRRLTARIVQNMGATAGAILLYDVDEQVLKPGFYYGYGELDMSTVRVPLGRGFAGRVAAERQPVAIDDLAQGATLVNPSIRKRGIRAMAGVPIMVGDNLLGIAHVDRIDVHHFGTREVRYLAGMAAQAALAIQRATLHQQLAAANRELASANQRLQTVIETIPAGVVILDAEEGRVTSANLAAERVWGCSPSPEAGFANLQRRYGFHHPNGEPYDWQELPMVRSIRDGQTVAGEEMVVRRTDGKELLALVSSAPLQDVEGNVRGAVVVFQDTSSMALERIKDEFVSVTAHELFTPLTIIKGTAQLLSRRVESEEGNAELLEALQTIDGQANWMVHLLQKLADASELRLNTPRLRRSPTDLVWLARLTARRFQATTDKHDIVLSSEVDKIVGLWDKDRINRVMANLVENAIKYSPQGGRVKIEVRLTDSNAAPDDRAKSSTGERRWALVRVVDHGIGIAKEEQAHLFRRFYRAGPSQYQEAAGLGLGLYIANRIVASHGGHMGVASEPGRGSSFYFTLPLHEAPPTVEATPGLEP